MFYALISSSTWGRFRKKLLLLALCLGSLLFAGCINSPPVFFPNGATQIVTITKEGKVSVAYSGNYKSIYSALVEFLKYSKEVVDTGANSRNSRKNTEQDFLYDLKKKYPDIKITAKGKGNFEFKVDGFEIESGQIKESPLGSFAAVTEYEEGVVIEPLELNQFFKRWKRLKTIRRVVAKNHPKTKNFVKYSIKK